MKRNEPNDCRACYVKDCDCTCNTCKAAQERNDKLSNEELSQMNLKSAIEAQDEHIEKD